MTKKQIKQKIEELYFTKEKYDGLWQLWALGQLELKPNQIEFAKNEILNWIRATK